MSPSTLLGPALAVLLPDEPIAIAMTTDIAKMRFNGSDVDFCKHMTEHARVAAIPLSVFYTGEEPRTLVRFAFCKKREVLDEALRRLASYFPRN